MTGKEAVAGADRMELVQVAGHRLRSIQVIGGFLDGIGFDLADGLNCIIGARGTGKTTALELARYALDALPPLDNGERQRIEKLVEANLGDGTVELTIETREGLTYKVIRSCRDEPAVMTADGSATEISLRSGGAFRADIYSQNEIEQIADEALSQLSLIDRFEPEAVAHLNAELRTLTSRLATNATTLFPLQDQINAINSEIASLPGIEEKLKALGPIAGRNAETVTKAQHGKSLRQQEIQALRGLWEFLQQYNQQIEDLRGQIASQTVQWLPKELSTGPNGHALSDVKKTLLDGGAEVDTQLLEVKSRLSQMESAIRDAGTTLRGVHAQQEAAYQELVRQDAAFRGQAAQRVNLEQMKNNLLIKQRQRDALIEKQSSLQRDRTQMLQKLSELRDSRYSVRTGIAETINGALMPAIRVTIEQSGHLGQYRALLEEALRGGRIKQGVVAQRIVERIAPAELVVLIRRADVGEIEQRCGINEDQARKVVDALKNTERLFSLETVELADRPRIQLKDGEEYKDSSALSTGQKCTTILPILLLDSDSPLLVDQPEDNLDNRFVCESVVESIRKVKTRRQLVFVTHNPNIPVLADAERVFVLESDGARAQMATAGNVDECRDAIVNLLEGGEDAFKRRQERYAY